MYTTDVFFKQRTRVRDHEEAMDAIESLLVAWSRNGQITDAKWPVAVVRGGYRATVVLPEESSLAESLQNRAVQEMLRKVRRTGLEGPDARVIGREPDSAEVCECGKRSSLILETDFLEGEVPLRCGDCFGTVPLYRFPHTTEYGTYEDIIWWAKSYHCLDELWTGRETGSRLAYHELSDAKSDLSRDGRDICRRIERLSRTPTYYYLFRYLGRSLASERKRRCPGCDRAWLLEQQWHDRYDFRCERCRLVSNIAYGLH